MSKPVLRVPMNEDEKIARDCLKGVRMLPASFEKRFRNYIVEMDTISEREAPQLWRLLIRYRRQWDHPDKQRLLIVAEKLCAPEFRKQNAAIEAQRRIDEMKEKWGEPEPNRQFDL